MHQDSRESFKNDQNQITQYFDWVKDKTTIQKVEQSYLDSLLGA